eukprot:gnl/Ergobibamus_cyprinoides/449.p4 GENE.gnl/Ergobibamus_cyprinoides/449~~gnl/Ergobibamus_cyprinoides/449.p4  ORF type:complete len:107 (+),score=45.08 gnl/Ergobibamus_cyprinoides/449:921-1241(+)
MPFESAVRVFDVFLNEGEKIVYRVALAFFDDLAHKSKARIAAGKPDTILNASFEDSLRLLQDAPKKVADVDAFFESVFAVRLSRAEIRALELEHERALAAELGLAL